MSFLKCKRNSKVDSYIFKTKTKQYFFFFFDLSELADRAVNIIYTTNDLVDGNNIVLYKQNTKNIRSYEPMQLN